MIFRCYFERLFGFRPLFYIELVNWISSVYFFAFRVVVGCTIGGVLLHFLNLWTFIKVLKIRVVLVSSLQTRAASDVRTRSSSGGSSTSTTTWIMIRASVIVLHRFFQTVIMNLISRWIAQNIQVCSFFVKTFFVKIILSSHCSILRNLWKTKSSSFKWPIHVRLIREWIQKHTRWQLMSSQSSYWLFTRCWWLVAQNVLHCVLSISNLNTFWRCLVQKTISWHAIHTTSWSTAILHPSCFLASSWNIWSSALRIFETRIVFSFRLWTLIFRRQNIHLLVILNFWKGRWSYIDVLDRWLILRIRILLQWISSSF